MEKTPTDEDYDTSDTEIDYATQNSPKTTEALHLFTFKTPNYILI